MRSLVQTKNEINGYIIRFAQQRVESPGRISKSMTNHCFKLSSYIEISRYIYVVTVLCGWLGKLGHLLCQACLREIGV